MKTRYQWSLQINIEYEKHHKKWTVIKFLLLYQKENLIDFLNSHYTGRNFNFVEVINGHLIY